MKLAFLLPERMTMSPIEPNKLLGSERGLTGSDGSCIAYAQAMAHKGHQVTVFISCEPVLVDGIQYRPYREWELGGYKECYDAVLSWMIPDGLRLVKSGLRIFNQQVNDYFLCPLGWEDWVDITTSPSHSHANYLSTQTQFSKNKWRVMYNGVDCSQFYPKEKIPGKVIWASSHDRGLHWLLEAWPHIVNGAPHAELHIFYNFDGCLKFARYENTGDSMWNELGFRSRYVIECIKRYKKNVHFHGSVSRERIIDEMASSEVLAYPCDPVNEYTEGFGVTVLEACASGVVPILCFADAFQELWGSVAEGVSAPYKDHKEEFIEKVIDVLNDQTKRSNIATKCIEHAKQFDWSILADDLEQTLVTYGQSGMVPAFSEVIIDQSQTMIVDDIQNENKPYPIIDFILSDYAIGCGGRFNSRDLFNDPRGLSGTEINAFGNAFELAKIGYKIRFFSRWTEEYEDENFEFIDLDKKVLRSDVAIAYHDRKPLDNWNTKFKIYSCHTYSIDDGVLGNDVDLYLSPTELHKQFHEKAGGKWEVFPNACDLGDFKPWNPEKGRMIFHTDPLRGLHILLKALPEIKRRVPEAHLHIYSKGTFTEERIQSLRDYESQYLADIYTNISNMIEQQRDYVTVYKHLCSKNEILEAISKSAVFAYPSEPPAPCEVFPISIMECCATGVPVVLSPADGIEELYCDAVELVASPPSQHLEEFIEATIKVLTDENYSKQLSEKGKNWVNEFNFGKTSIRLSDLIKESMNKKKLRIGFFIPEFWVSKPINPNDIWTSSRGLNGSEGSCIGYALAMSHLGHSVTIFTKFTHVGDIENITCCPYSEWGSIYHKQDWDVLCSWLGPDPFKIAKPGVFKLFNQQISDFSLNEPGWESYVDILTPLSNSHANYLTDYTNFPKDKWRICNNGVDTDKFTPGIKIPGKVIWASSHDRGLHRLLEVWPRIKKNAPHANLHIFYDFHAAECAINDQNEFGNRSRYTLKQLEILKGDEYGVFVYGSTSREQIQQEMASAEFLFFPLDPIRYTETFSVTVLEACSSGCVPVICLNDCFEELWASVSETVPSPYENHKEEYVNKAISLLNDTGRRKLMAEKCVEHARQYNWSVLAKDFETTLLTKGENGLPNPVWDDTNIKNDERFAVKQLSFRGHPYQIRHIKQDPTSSIWHGSWWSYEDEHEIRDLFWDIKPGDIVMDIGAAYGSYTVTALACGASYVYSWSPQIEIGGDGYMYVEKNMLYETLILNGWQDKCAVYDWGCYSKSGWIDTLTQNFTDIEPSRYFFDVCNTSKVDPIIKVSVLNDWWRSVGSPKIDWMKLDVEGAEVEVLKGAIDIIKAHKPNILVENHNFKRASIEQEIRDFLINLGYSEVGTRQHTQQISHSFYTYKHKNIITGGDKIKPRISIIIPTFRPGGLDVLTSGLNNQTFQDFELIIVDMIKQYRHDKVDFSYCKYPVQHVEPLNNSFPFSSYSHIFNTGLVYAKGDIVLISSDYLWFPPDCLQKHADFHEQNLNCVYCGSFTYLESPLLNSVPKTLTKVNDKAIFWMNALERGATKYTYVDDLNTGKYDHVMWSLFEEPIISDPRFRCNTSQRYVNTDPRLSLSKGWYDWHCVCFKHESFPLELALQVNGCDEDFDGAHGYEDFEFAERMQSLGVRWFCDPENIIYGFTMQDEILPRLRKLRPTHGNRGMIALKRAVEYRIPNSPLDPNLSSDIYNGRPCNDWSIKDYREELMALKLTRELEFKGFKYKIEYLNDKNNATYINFDDKVSVRDSFWNINKDDVVLDVGSCYGSYTLPALASGAKYVYAWNPHGYKEGVLEKSLKLNGWTKRCDIYEYGLYDRSGYLDVISQQFFKERPSEYNENIIEVITLDEWDRATKCDKIDVIKLDVEGAEVEILIGGKQLINKHRPIIVIENHIFKRPQVCEEIRNILSLLNYKEICNIPYKKPYWPEISHSLWIPNERENPNQVYPEAHFG